jgi:GcrA cell cycle regulator
MTAVFWTPEREAKAKQLFIGRGLTAEATAQAIGATSRHAVISIARRRGWKKGRAPKAEGVNRPLTAPAVKAASLAKPPKPEQHLKPADVFGAGYQPAATKAEELKISQTQAKVGKAVVAGFAAPANDTAMLLIDRGRFQCSWPVGEPERPADQMCCGAPVANSESKTVPTYCAVHAKAAVGRTVPQNPREYVRSMRRYA